MTIEVQSDDPNASILLQGENEIPDSAETNLVDGHVPKIRKPYTITKQRERWTEEEHNRFLEALKLYGRAWRKIEEHVGSKTAVQIRSHAQKFFSKVVRETNGSSNSSSVEPIEIPPPRPKKKPSHPYPRKLVLPAKKETVVDTVEEQPVEEQPAGSVSPKSSIDRENQSPASVFSAIASDSEADRSPSPGSCLPIEEESNMEENISDESDESISLKLELFPHVETCDKEGSVETTSRKSLKLFGKTVPVTDELVSSLSLRWSDELKGEEGEEGIVAQSSSGQIDAEFSMVNAESTSPCGVLPAHSSSGQVVAEFSMVNAESTSPCGVLPAQSSSGQVVAEFSMVNAESTSPCGVLQAVWGLYGGLPYTFIPLNNHVVSATEMPTNPEMGDQQTKASGCSSSNMPWSWEVECTQSNQLSLEFQKRKKDEGRSDLRSKSSNKRGFVPYKRCLSARDAQLSTLSGGGGGGGSEEKERPRTRLCL